MSVCVYKQSYYRRNHEIVKGMEEVGVGESDGIDLNTEQVRNSQKIKNINKR